jgi:hypothetical protein
MSRKKVSEETLFEESDVEHTVTEDDLIKNPELKKEGVEVGDTIGIPKEEPVIDPLTSATTDATKEMLSKRFGVKKLGEGRYAVVKEDGELIRIYEEETCIEMSARDSAIMFANKLSTKSSIFVI